MGKGKETNARYEDNRMKEINDSTHAYFRIHRLDPFGKKVKKQETGVINFGDTIPSPSSHGQQKIKFCIPHGKGKIILENGDTVLCTKVDLIMAKCMVLVHIYFQMVIGGSMECFN